MIKECDNWERVKTVLPIQLWQSDRPYQAIKPLEIVMNHEQEIYTELSYYTLAHGDAAFIHQHVMDAFAAQT